MKAETIVGRKSTIVSKHKVTKVKNKIAALATALNNPYYKISHKTAAHRLDRISSMLNDEFYGLKVQGIILNKG